MGILVFKCDKGHVIAEARCMCAGDHRSEPLPKMRAPHKDDEPRPDKKGKP